MTNISESHSITQSSTGFSTTYKTVRLFNCLRATVGKTLKLLNCKYLNPYDTILRGRLSLSVLTGRKDLALVLENPLTAE